MELEKQQNISTHSSFSRLNQVTPLSKYLALAVFIILPLITLYIGTVFAPVEYVEVERVVYRAPLPATADANSRGEAMQSKDASSTAELHAVEKTGDNGFAESDIYVENTLVLQAAGSCNFTPYNGDALPAVESLQKLVGSGAVEESGTCWLPGGGSSFYLVRAGDLTSLIGMTMSECGNLPSNECFPYGEAQVMYKIDGSSNGAVLYKGSVFGG